MFGRPLAVASHHFDTALPSISPPASTNPPQPRLYAPNIALFRLAYILGDIMDSAVSLRPVPYETVLAHDKLLSNWMDTLPPELDLDEFRIARALASQDIVVRRLGVQSVIIRTSYYHIRFTLHRPYASSSPSPPLSSGSKDKDDKAKQDPRDTAKSERQANSLDIAVGSADKLITLVDHARPDFLANASLAVPGHMSWGPFHVFSAAMFFSFQLISNPNQPGAGLFRANIKKALGTLELSRGQAVADRALDILGALLPLYEVGFADMEEAERESVKGRVLKLVKTLAFPYHDQSRGSGRGTGDSPNGGYASGSPSGYAGSPAGGYTSGSPSNVPGVFGGSPSARRDSVDYASHQHAQRYIPSSTSPPVPYTYPESRGYSDVRGSYDGGRGYGDGASRATAAPQPTAATTATTTTTTYPDPPPQTAQPRNPYPPSGSSGVNPYPTGQAPSQGYSDSVRSYPSSDKQHSLPPQASYPESRPYPSSVGVLNGSNGGGGYPYPYQAPVEVETMWGASLSQPEWVRFLDVMQRPPGERG